MTRPDQNRVIHAMRRALPAFSDADYRAHLQTRFKVASSRDLTTLQAADLIDDLARMQGNAGGRRSSRTANGPYAKVLQALWLAAYNLGAIREKDDAAMIAFVKRQTGLDHTRFLTDAADAARAIEALKAMCARAGVVWPKGEASRDPCARKLAVIEAQARILRDGPVPTFDLEQYALLANFPKPSHCDSRRLDRLSAQLGDIIRRRAT